MLLLQCPKCKNRMKYQNMTSNLDKKRKVCVYCGKSMDVKKSFVKKL